MTPISSFGAFSSQVPNGLVRFLDMCVRRVLRFSHASLFSLRRYYCWCCWCCCWYCTQALYDSLSVSRSLTHTVVSNLSMYYPYRLNCIQHYHTHILSAAAVLGWLSSSARLLRRLLSTAHRVGLVLPALPPQQLGTLLSGTYTPRISRNHVPYFTESMSVGTKYIAGILLSLRGVPQFMGITTEVAGCTTADDT